MFPMTKYVEPKELGHLRKKLGSLRLASAIVGVRNIFRVNPGDCSIKITVKYGRKWK
jgi:hypothetical protein